MLGTLIELEDTSGRNAPYARLEELPELPGRLAEKLAQMTVEVEARVLTACDVENGEDALVPGAPEKLTPEWFVVDLFENARSAGTSPEMLADSLRRAMATRAFDPERLRDAARRFGSRRTQALVEGAIS